MSLTALQLANSANALLDYYMPGDALAFSQSIQDQPLTKALIAAKKYFPGGKGNIKGNVKGEYTSEFTGYSGDDTVTYQNPANIKQFEYPWFELHAGIQITNTELKQSGITVIDTAIGENTSVVTESDKVTLTNLLTDKIKDLKIGSANSLDLMMHRDGSQDSKVFAGISSLISITPTVGLTGGLDRGTHTWWRNRYSAITSNTTTSNLILTLRQEVRQLRRYGGKPNLIIAGVTAINKLEAEIIAKGEFTQNGFSKDTDIAMGDISYGGIGVIKYDPTLDDEGKEDYMYIIDTNHVFPMIMTGEENKTHAPARPAEKYVIFRAKTWTGCLIARRLNSCGVYRIS